MPHVVPFGQLVKFLALVKIHRFLHVEKTVIGAVVIVQLFVDFRIGDHRVVVQPLLQLRVGLLGLLLVNHLANRLLKQGRLLVFER